MTVSVSATCVAIAVLFYEFEIASGQGTLGSSGPNPPPVAPWHSLLYKSETQSTNSTRIYICGATIIRSDLLLTAAHCVYDDDKNEVEPVERFDVIVGQLYADYVIDLSNVPATNKHKVRKIHVECQYMGAIDYYALDIAILELDTPFNFSRAVWPVFLDNDLAKNKTILDDDGSFAKVATYGGITEGNSSALLHAITVPYVDSDQCKRFTDIPYYSEKDKFCVGCSNETLGYGDGGSGLVFQREGLWHLRGIVSVGLAAVSENAQGNCHNRFYVLNTDINFHWGWLLDVISGIDNDVANCWDQRPIEPHDEPRMIYTDDKEKITNQWIPPPGSSGEGRYNAVAKSRKSIVTIPKVITSRPYPTIHDNREPQVDWLDMSAATDSQEGPAQDCSLLVRLCFGDSCLSRLFPCNDVFASAVLPRESRIIQDPTIKNIITRNSPGNDDIFCDIPPNKRNSTWEIFDCNNPVTCGIAAELRFRPGERVSVRCDRGYKPTNATTVVCGNDGAWVNIPECTAIRCPQLTSHSTRAVCTLFGKSVGCDSDAEISTKAKVSCNNAYQISTGSYTMQREKVKCGSEGKWEPDPIQCIPECGLITTGLTPLIAGGRRADISGVPWHATLYKSENETMPKVFICGGTIIRWNMILTAAHCVHAEGMKRVEPAKTFFVTAGNSRQDYNDPKNNQDWIQKSTVKNIFVHCDYLGANGHYDLDIAVLELTEGFTFTAVLRPVCLDWYGDVPSPEVGNKGVIAGFGRYAKESNTSTHLQTATLPYVSDEECRKSVGIAKLSHLKTHGKFCAGYHNGTAVCTGDSGGGLVFKIGDLWYLQGIVSTSIARNLPTEESCDTSSYSLYTRVTAHIKFIKDATHYVEKRLPFPSCIPAE